MSDVIIKLENISKQYRLGQVGTQTLRGDLQRWWHTLRGKEDPNLKIGTSNKLDSVEGEYVWALRDINLEVIQGEVLGIIGKNGAGKSTLLKLLSRVTGPTTGSIKVKGRIASLLEVGTGFHPELTGRENIFLNGAILGMTKAEIRSKFDEIVEFAGVAKYIDTPVKRYSSGMYVRLAFAVAAHLEPDILVVDEVLAVGDAEFQKKAIGKMQDISTGGGRTVLFVSHNMGAISALCTKTLLLKNGKKVSYGKTSDIIIEYLNFNNTVISKHWKCNYVKDVPYFTEIIFNSIIQNQPKLKLDLSIKIEVPGDVNLPIIAFDILDNTDVPVFQAIAQDRLTLRKGTNEKSLEIELPPLIPGDYVLNAWIGPHNTITYHHVLHAIKFTVEEAPLSNWTFPFSKDHGHLIMNVDIK